MKISLHVMLVVAGILMGAASAEDAGDEAIRKDRQRIKGVWQITSLVVSGNRSTGEDAKKLTVVNDAQGNWILRSNDMKVSQGTSAIDPAQELKSIDLTPTEGEAQDDVFLGIYHLGKNTRKLCFAPVGRKRPLGFMSTAENEHILVTFERVKPDSSSLSATR